MNRLQLKLNTLIGPLYLVASEEALYGVHWKKQSSPMGTNSILQQTVKELEEYFSGKRKLFEIPLSAQGTAFQKKVWSQLSKIPYGKTCSYRDIATRIQNEKAVRAVGTANGRNPISIIVPCHRVIAADGTLGGYAGGLKIKTILLELEKNHSL